MIFQDPYLQKHYEEYQLEPEKPLSGLQDSQVSVQQSQTVPEQQLSEAFTRRRGARVGSKISNLSEVESVNSRTRDNNKIDPTTPKSTNRQLRRIKSNQSNNPGLEGPEFSVASRPRSQKKSVSFNRLEDLESSNSRPKKKKTREVQPVGGGSKAEK